MTLYVKKLSGSAQIPVRGTAGSAGYDLFSAHSHTIPPHQRRVCSTDIAVNIPPGCYGRVAPRSGLTVKHEIDVGAGVIDRDYIGNVGVVLINHSDKDFRVEAGMRIAQLILESCVEVDVEEVHDDFAATERGSGGFGSTGK